MHKFIKAVAFVLLIPAILCFGKASARDISEITAKSVVLLESSTGQVIYENCADEPLPPASITKIMTLLLIMEDIDSGKIGYNDIVTASERAKSMGGSTIFLDAGERMSVYDLVKGIVVASGNDACVAMAEHLEGSVEAFVERMNRRASELGMVNTVFKNTNGLPAEGHVMSARDIAIVSNELIKHKEIFNFTTIWTDSLRGGEFLLANTNKLIRFYEGANGLKTGSTDEAGCCISATAKRDGMQLIAVVLGSPTSNDRFSDAKALLDYGFANYALWYGPTKQESLGRIKVRKGEKEIVDVGSESGMYALLKKGMKGTEEILTEIADCVEAPVSKGQVLGKVRCVSGGEIISECNLVALEDVGKIGLGALYKKMIGFLLHI